MKDGQWEDWTEPLEVLFTTAKEFIDTVRQISTRISELPIGGQCIVAPQLFTRKEELGKALAAFVRWNLSTEPTTEPKGLWTTDFLNNYIYVSSVYCDVMGLVFEYMGENEHQMDLHGNEFAQTADDLKKDFALYIENWQSPHVKR